MEKKDCDIFQQKAKDNAAIADKSVEAKIYHTAISRYYYSLYQKMLYVLYAEGIYESYNPKRPHGVIYHDFYRIAKSKYSDKLGIFGIDSLG